MPMNWKGKKGQGPKKAQAKLDSNKKASSKLQAKPGNQGAALADAAIAKSKASSRKTEMAKPSTQRRTK